ncbi:hypothetical protein E2562_007460, partial [Oryza meyeriana var. granulata]
DYESACEALYDGFKLDPGNSEIEDALRRYALHSSSKYWHTMAQWGAMPHFDGITADTVIQ